MVQIKETYSIKEKFSMNKPRRSKEKIEEMTKNSGDIANIRLVEIG